MSSAFKISNVYLFSHGMAFFTYSGIITKDLNTETNFFSLKVKKRDLNDILNSLVVSITKGTITSISYSSEVEETIDKKYLTKTNYLNYLVNNLRGVNVTLSTVEGEEYTGIITGKELYSTKSKKKKEIEENVIIWSDGKFRQLPFKNIENVAINNNKVIEDLEKALTVASSQNEEEIVLKFYYEVDKDQTQFESSVGFMIEIPLWKINYRIILPAKELDNDEQDEHVIMNSYCLISNPLDEDWIDVDLSLITGRPISFLYDLNRIDYLTRIHMPPPLIETSVPQSSLNGTTTTGKPSLAYDIVPGSHPSTSGGIKGFNKELELGSFDIVKSSHLNKLRLELINNVNDLMKKEKDNDIVFKPLEDLYLSKKTEDNYSAMNLGENFVFKLKGKKTIKSDENAIIPLFVNLKLPCKKLLFHDTSKKEISPYTSLEIINEAPYPLEFGPAVVFEANSPVGEALFPTCFSSQSRIVSYSKEPRVTIIEHDPIFKESKKTYTFLKHPLYLIESANKISTVTFDISSQLPKEDMDSNKILLVMDYDYKYQGKLVEEELDKNLIVKTLEKGHRFSINLNKKEIQLKLTYKEKLSNKIYYRKISKEQYLFLNDDIPDGIDDIIKTKFEKKFELSGRLDKLKDEKIEFARKRILLEDYIKRIRGNLNVILEKSKLRNNFVGKLTSYEDEIDGVTNNIDKLNIKIKSLENEIYDLFNPSRTGGN